MSDGDREPSATDDPAPAEPVDEAVLAAWETNVVLADGSTARIRPIRPDDRERLRDFHGRQSSESIYFRYFRFRPELSEQELTHFTTVDYSDRMAFVAVRDDELIAVARYEPYGDRNEAEVAFFIDDGHNGRGLATILLEFLAAAGRRRKLDGFTATVLPENYGMLRVFRKAGFAVSTKFADGVIEVTLGITVTEDTEAAIGARERRAIARSVARILEPRSVAVVGPSRRRGSVGHEVLRHLLAAPFAGSVSVVHAEASEVQGVPAVPRVTDLAEPPDLAVVVVPTHAVEQVAADCVAAGAGALLVISAGFSESGPSGAERERRLVELARNGGVRLVGPNAFGIANTDPEVNLRALFLPVAVVAGHVGLLSQSGPLGAAVLDDLARSGVGVSSFAALGNRADVSVNDLIQYWASDERTRAIALYVENYGNLRTFTALAREVALTKPIISVETPDDDVNEMLRQSGVILVAQISDLADQARLAIDQPLPEGRRVAVVSNTSSVARLAVAACRRAGLEISGPNGGATLVGDVDQLDEAITTSLSIYERAVAEAALSADVDAVLVALVPSLDLPVDELRDLLVRVDRAVAKPIVATGLVAAPQLELPGIPTFTFPEGAAAVLGRAARHAEWRRGASHPPLIPSPDRGEGIRDEVGALLGSDSGTRLLGNAESQRLSEVLGIRFAPSIETIGTEAAVGAAASIGYPVAVKALGLDVRTAGESGGTALDIQTEDQLVESIARMRARFGDRLDPLLVQRMVPTGVHIAIELRQDFERGASLSLGPGGSGAGVRVQRHVRALPASRADLAMLCVGDWLLETTTVDERASIEQLLVALSEAAAAAPELARIELNPILVGPEGAVAVDGSFQLRAWPTNVLDGLRHL